MDTNTLLLELLREVKALREDNKLLHDKLDALTVSKQDDPKRNVGIKNQCTALTAKGSRCKKGCLDGTNTCKMHANKTGTLPPENVCVNDYTEDNNNDNETPNQSSQSNGGTRPRPKLKPKLKSKSGGKKSVSKKPDPPKHNHLPGEIPTEPCELCDTHGDVTDPDLINTEYEEVNVGGKSIEERLLEVIENESMREDDDDMVLKTQIKGKSWADMVDEDE
tara:strand:- start:2108 stop:2770 length:663 start_codon:yes stop_codon:yes gene_type:complete